MPRANRFYSPGIIWHITHRCHNREFLLKFERDRRCWKHWLYQARKRFGLIVLNYIATSNHIHLLVQGNDRACIPKSMQLISGRVAQEYNRRKSRQGAFWEGRYFATAIGDDRHLIKCLTYIDLNMVRAGRVDHPSQWAVCGYREIQSPPTRYRIIDFKTLCSLVGSEDRQMLALQHRNWVDSELANGCIERQPQWTESIAVGSHRFVEQIRSKLANKVRYRASNYVSEGMFAIEEDALDSRYEG